MSSVTDEITMLRDEIATMRDQLRLLSDRAEIGDLLDRYIISVDGLDEVRFDAAWARSIFTDGVVLEFPPGNHEGMEGIGEFHAEVMNRFEKTWHLSSNHLIEVHGDRATVRMTLTATHVHLARTRLQRGDDSPFVVGDYFNGEVVRTPEGWRIRRMKLNVVWTLGKPPVGVDVEA